VPRFRVPSEPFQMPLRRSRSRRGCGTRPLTWDDARGRRSGGAAVDQVWTSRRPGVDQVWTEDRPCLIRPAVSGRCRRHGSAGRRQSIESVVVWPVRRCLDVRRWDADCRVGHRGDRLLRRLETTTAEVGAAPVALQECQGQCRSSASEPATWRPYHRPTSCNPVVDRGCCRSHCLGTLPRCGRIRPEMPS
jgi:hypothetical protein